MQNLTLPLEKHHPYAIQTRRYFHMYPELSGKEYHTQTKIMEELTELGIPCRKAAKTGVIAEVKGKLPGKAVAIRADMDALPIADECGAAYQSQNFGVCHACGHDGHMALLLGTIRLLHELKDQISGTYRFLFQPSEEQFPSGASAMVDDGALIGVDRVIGAHIWQPLPLGKVGVSYGNLMAAPDKFTITIQGKGGHGSMPHQANDPILLAAQVVLALHTIVSRSIDPLSLAALSVGSIHAGIAFNVIPDTAVIEGTVRSFDDAVRNHIFTRIDEISNGICAANRASCTVKKVFGHPAVINDPAISEVIAEATAACRAPLTAEVIPPVMSGEDFSYYQKQVPGAFFFIGTGSDKVTYPHHHPRFDIDETCLLYGMEVMTRAAIRLTEDK